MDHSQTLNPAGLEPTRATARSGAWAQALKSPLLLGLLVLLGVQILAAIGLSLGGRGSLTPASLDSPLLPFDAKSVTAIRIEGGSEGPVTLAKADQGWAIADLGDFPADGSKLDQLLDKLATLKRPLPVATSPEAQRRHKVADQGFERKVTLEAGDKPVATLLLGDSPGFRRVFARPAGESVVYDLELALSDISNRRDDWLSRDNLRLGQETIERVSSGDWTLVKASGNWRLEGSDQTPDEAAVSGLLSRIANLSYRGVLGNEDKPEYNQAAPTLEISVGLAGGTERRYRISQAKDSQDLVLKASDRPWYYKLSEFDLEGLKDLSRDKLLGAKPAEAGTAPADIEPAVPEDSATPAEGAGEPAAAAASAPSGEPVRDLDPTAEPEPAREPAPPLDESSATTAPQ
jgi:hypothetical protein